MLEGFDPTVIQDDKAREGYIILLNLVETLKAENERLRAEVQRLRDEINRLKGEQGKPTIKGNKPEEDHSTEKERRQPKQRKKRKKKKDIKVDREVKVEVDRSELPEDVVFKGYEEVVVQDIKIETDNVLFRKEKFYSPSQKKTYIAPQPSGYEGQFGPGIKALVTVFYFGCNMTEPKILDFFSNMNIELSAGQLSNLLIKKQDRFHAEKDEVYEAGLRSGPWQHSDWTGMRVNGENCYCHIVCNPLYAAYFTKAKKDRQTILEVLRNSSEREYVLNEQALLLLETLGLSGAKRKQLQGLLNEQVFSEQDFLARLEAHDLVLGPQQRRWVLDAAAIAAYHTQDEWPIIDLLLADDAPEFKLVTALLALCWVHEARHYKKLTPMVEHHQQVLDAFMKEFWDYYRDLLAYQQHPTPQRKAELIAEFKQLFSQKTSYWMLNERLALTKAKQTALLMVLDYPEIPLHNNAAELAARTRVRKRKISYGTRTEEGSQAWDTFMTLSETAKKLGVSFYHYILDRITETNALPSLADMITQRAQSMNLGTSWQFP